MKFDDESVRVVTVSTWQLDQPLLVLGSSFQYLPSSLMFLKFTTDRARLEASFEDACGAEVVFVERALHARLQQHDRGVQNCRSCQYQQYQPKSVSLTMTRQVGVDRRIVPLSKRCIEELSADEVEL